MKGPDAFFPGRVPISAYGKKGFQFADMQHDGALIILNDGIHRWRPQQLDDCELNDFAEILNNAKPGDIVLMGTGAKLAQPNIEIRKAFMAAHLGLDVMDTGAAVRTWNVLIAEDRSSFCALLPL